MLKRLLLVLAAVLFGSTSAASAGYLYNDKSSRPIVEVTEPSLLDFASAPTSIVLFYSPTCSACIRFKDKYVSFAKLVNDKYQDAIAVYAVSCNAGSQRKLCQDFKVTVYPTLRLTSNGGKDWTTLKKTRLTDTLQLDAILARQKRSLISLDKPHPAHKPVHVDSSKVKPVQKLEGDKLEDDDDDDEAEEADGGDNDNEEEQEQEGGGGEVKHLQKLEEPDLDDGDDEDEEAGGDEKEMDNAPKMQTLVGGLFEEKASDRVMSNHAEGADASPFNRLVGAAGIKDKHAVVNDEGDKDEDDEEENESDGEDANAAISEDGLGVQEDDDDDKDEDEDNESEDQPQHHADTAISEDGLGVQEDDDDDKDEDEDNKSEDQPQHHAASFGGTLRVADSMEDDDDSKDEEEDNESEDQSQHQERSFSSSHASGHFPHFPETKPGAAKARLVGKPGDISIMGQFSHRLKEKGGREKLSKPDFLIKPPKHHGKLNKIVPQEGATDNMAAHKPHTKEYLDRRAQILKIIAAKKGKDVSDKVKQRWKEMEESQGKVRLPYKKEVKKPFLMEKVPLVKRMVKLAPEEELMTDTSLSLIHGLKYGVYKLSGPLTADKKHALADWFELLSITLPEEWEVHDVIEDLMTNLNTISKSEANFHSILRRHKMERKTWSSTCTKSGTDHAHSCGFWKLLHVMSIGLAEHRGGQTLIDSGMRRPDTRLFSPSQAADVLRDYIKYFFLCDACSNNFLSTYDDCTKNRRCDRLAKDTATASDADWKEMGKWLWELHNDVNLRVMKEKVGNKKGSFRGGSGNSNMDTIAALWPTLEDCVKCFHDDGSWDEDALFVYLELEYWPDQTDSKMSRLLSFEDDFLYHSSSFGLFWILLVLIVVLLYVMQQNKLALQQAMLSARVRGTLSTQKRSV